MCIIIENLYDTCKWLLVCYEYIMYYKAISHVDEYEVNVKWMLSKNAVSVKLMWNKYEVNVK